MIKRRVIAGLLLLLCVIFMAACGSAATEQLETRTMPELAETEPIAFAPDQTPEPDPEPTPEPTPTPVPVNTYVLYTNTKRFHKPSCASVSEIKESNKEIFEGTRDEVIAMGYEPCGRCRP